MKNTMDRGEYIKEHVIWSLMLFLWFKNLIFRCIPNCTYTESLIGFLVISVCVMAVGIAVSWKRNRNYKNVIENILLSWGVFVCITYMELYYERIKYILFAIVVISSVLSVMILIRRVRRKEARKRIMMHRVERVVALWKRNAAVGMLLIIAPLGVSSLLYGTVFNSKVEVTGVYGDEDSLSANIEIISNIEPSKWDNLSVEDKLIVAQKIVNCEARYYGLSHEILVGTDDLSAGTLAYYSDSTHQVVIDLNHLTGGYSYEVLESLLHEAQHAYQYELVEVYRKLDAKERNLHIFHDTSVYMKEFANYEDGNEEENYYDYYTQLAEIHAREVGKTVSLGYIKAINEYLGIELDVDMSEFSCWQEYVDYISEE